MINRKYLFSNVVGELPQANRDRYCLTSISFVEDHLRIKFSTTPLDFTNLENTPTCWWLIQQYQVQFINNNLFLINQKENFTQSHHHPLYEILFKKSFLSSPSSFCSVIKPLQHFSPSDLPFILLLSSTAALHPQLTPIVCE